jgi:hypothetical protein
VLSLCCIRVITWLHPDYHLFAFGSSLCSIPCFIFKSQQSASFLLNCKTPKASAFHLSLLPPTLYPRYNISNLCTHPVRLAFSTNLSRTETLPLQLKVSISLLYLFHADTVPFKEEAMRLQLIAFTSA